MSNKSSLQETDYDYLIVGAGFYGAICAYELNKAGYKCLVVDKRSHIGGNCYTENKDGINLHVYGPHIFHTSNEKVWKWINKFVTFNDFTYRPVANYYNEIYSLPFNMWTFSKIFNVVYPDQVKRIINDESEEIKGEPTNLEEQAIKIVGRTVYEKLIKGYTEKQWMKDAKLLPKEIIKRLPVRYTYDNNYFNDKYQGIPVGGYTQIFEKLLEGIDVKLNFDYLKAINKGVFAYGLIKKKIIFTGAIDEFFGYKYGPLEYKTVRFENKLLREENYQGVAVMNFTSKEIPFTRVIEHKHFEKSNSPFTWVTWEYPEVYSSKTEPMYPVNDIQNNERYQKYKTDADKEFDFVHFGGRLAEYKYYDMHQVIESALNFVENEIKRNN